MSKALKEYEAATTALGKYCEAETDLTAVIVEDEYPLKVRFVPERQVSIFPNENVNADGTTNELTVTVGLTTSVKSTLKFKMDSKQLKKLIKLAEKVGTLYYHAFREYQGEKLMPCRPLFEPDGVYCPGCGNQIFDVGHRLIFCRYCGKALNTLPEDESKGEETEE